MPKFSKIQSNFTAGEVSQSIWGRVDVVERYDSAVQTLLNYIPTLQGPVVRRPGTKYVTNVKDSTKPGLLQSFQLSGTQGYALEFGDKYVRFFTNDGQAVTNTTVFSVGGTYNTFGGSSGFTNSPYSFNATRLSSSPGYGEFPPTFRSSVITVGAALELTTPYSYNDIPLLRFSQKGSTLVITHPNYPVHQLVRNSALEWTIKAFEMFDGPYLPLNSYQSIADSANVNFTGLGFDNVPLASIQTGPSFICSSVFSASGLIRIATTTPHNFVSGSKVFVIGVAGTNEANNVNNSNFNSSTITACAFWSVNYINATTIELQGSKFTNAWVGSGVVFPALFLMNSTGSWADCNISTNSVRPIGLIQGGIRIPGVIYNVLDSANAFVLANQGFVYNTSLVTLWQMGTYSGINGYPLTSCFHQNRLYLAGSPIAAQQLDGSYVGNYNLFAASGSNSQVTDANAVQFSLLSQDIQPIYWIKPSSQGLLAGSLSGEWQISPSNQNAGITPTNITAQQVAAFGSANIDAILLGNAAVYVQKAQRKIRELNYFFQAGTFRSTNVSELAEHLTLPSVTKLVLQKEINPLVWGLRSDGQLISLSYNRDEQSLKAGWARHQLGGQSDSAGSPPAVKSMAVITASSGFFDELWMTVQRSINNSSVVTIEYMTRPFDFTSLQEDSYYLDCGGTLDTPIVVSAVSNAASCVVTAPNHGISASSVVRFYSSVGLNSSTIDVNGNITTNNLINEKTFVVASTSTNAFKLTDFTGADVSSAQYTSYLGSAVVRKLISTVTGVTWLPGENVSILGDGGIMNGTTVSQTGAVGLAIPSAKVQVGYSYNSDLQLLRTKDGSAQGTSIGSTRRINRVAMMLHSVGEMSIGPTFTNLIPVEFTGQTSPSAGNPATIVDGIFREGFQGPYTYDDYVCVRQSAPLPGMIQSIVRFLEEQDV